MVFSREMPSMNVTSSMGSPYQSAQNTQNNNNNIQASLLKTASGGSKKKRGGSVTVSKLPSITQSHLTGGQDVNSTNINLVHNTNQTNQNGVYDGAVKLVTPNTGGSRKRKKSKKNKKSKKSKKNKKSRKSKKSRK